MIKRPAINKALLALGALFIAIAFVVLIAGFWRG